MRIVDLDVAEANLRLVREIGNGALAVLSAVMVIMLGLFVLRRFQDPAGGVRRGWYDEPGTQIAIALMVLVFGKGLRSTWIWLLLSCQNVGGDCGWMYRTPYVIEAAVLISIVGGLCIIRVLSPREWLPWSWLGSTAVCVGVPLVYYWVHWAR